MSFQHKNYFSIFFFSKKSQNKLSLSTVWSSGRIYNFNQYLKKNPGGVPRSTAYQLASGWSWCGPPRFCLAASQQQSSSTAQEYCLLLARQWLVVWCGPPRFCLGGPRFSSCFCFCLLLFTSIAHHDAIRRSSTSTSSRQKQYSIIHHTSTTSTPPTTTSTIIVLLLLSSVCSSYQYYARRPAGPGRVVGYWRLVASQY